MKKPEPTPAAYLEAWLDAVASGEATMSQRSLPTLQKHGGLAAARKAAKKRGVHLVLLRDDKGKDLVAASKDPFKMIC